MHPAMRALLGQVAEHSCLHIVELRASASACHHGGLTQAARRDRHPA